jgi:hypothetical protein
MKKKKYFFALKINQERSRIRSWVRSGSISQKCGSGDPDPDPHQNVKDHEHCQIGGKFLSVVDNSKVWGK